MQFNPLFIPAGAQTESATTVKPSKLTNSSYLFSDIIRIINENLLQSNSAKQNSNTNGTLSNVLTNVNNSTSKSIENLIPVQENLKTQNTSSDSNNLQTFNFDNIDIASLVNKLAALFNALGISADSLKLNPNDNFIQTNTDLQTSLSSSCNGLKTSNVENQKNKNMVDLTNQLKSTADSYNVEKIYTLIQNLFTYSNLTINKIVNPKVEEGGVIKDNSAKNNSSKDNQATDPSAMVGAILNLLQNKNNVEIKLPGANIKISLSDINMLNGTNKIADKSFSQNKTPQNAKANNSINLSALEDIGMSTDQLSDTIISQDNSELNQNMQGLFQNKNNVEIKLQSADLKISSSKGNLFDETNKVVDKSFLQNLTLQTAKDQGTNNLSNLSENSTSINQPSNAIQSELENSFTNLNLQDIVSGKISKSNFCSNDNQVLHPHSAKMNIVISFPKELKTTQAGSSVAKTENIKFEDFTPFNNEIPIQNNGNFNTQVQLDPKNISQNSTQKLDQNLLKDVKSIQIDSNKPEMETTNTLNNGNDQFQKPNIESLGDNKNIQTKIEHTIVQPVDNLPKAQSDNSHQVNISDNDLKAQIIVGKSDSSAENNQSKNNSDSNKNGDLKFILNQLNNVKNNVDSADIKNVSSFESNSNQVKTVNISEVVNEITNLVKQGSTKSIVLNLKPESLGSMKVTVDVSKNTVHANVEVDTEAVKLIVQNNINDLKQSLALNGMQLNSFTVNVSGGEQKFGKALNQKKKSNYHSIEQKVEINNNSLAAKSMGYNTYEYLI